MPEKRETGNAIPRKLMFFDIDGTLIPYRGQVSESTVTALKRAKAEGHQLFLCSGRSECSLPQAILEIGFDGIVSATGATISYHGQRVRMLSVGEKIHKLVRVLEDCQVMYTLQVPEASLCTPKAEPWVRKKRMEEFHIAYRDIPREPEKYANAEKAVVFYSPIPLAELANRLAPEFEITASSFDLRNLNSCEITMAGVNKSSAMAWLGEYLGISRENMIAFGDGPNDLDMLQFAGFSVAMGNAVPATKAMADYVTGAVTEDGIYHALKYILNW